MAVRLTTHIRFVLLWFTLLSVPGCSMWQMGVQNLVHAPMKFSEPVNRHWNRKRTKRVAIAAFEIWNQSQTQETGTSYSPDFRKGFIAGFVDQSVIGGDTIPPALPPMEYWRGALPHDASKQRWQSQQWFAGFDEGARVALALMDTERLVETPMSPLAGMGIPLETDETLSSGDIALRNLVPYDADYLEQ